jgi:hypothetical protein
MRLDQREGRSVRYGSAYPQIEVVRFAPPPALEHALGMGRLLEQKSRLPATVGLGPKGKHVWRWRADLALRFSGMEAVAGTALVASEAEGILAGFTLHGAGSSPSWLSSTVLWLEPDETWTEAPEVLANRLEQAAAAGEIIPIDSGRLRSWLQLLARPIKERLKLAARRRWITPEPSPVARRMAARLQGFTRAAARTHRPDRLIRLEHALGFITRGHTAGETALIERLADSSDPELERALSTLPAAHSLWDGIAVRLSGLILFGPTT